MFCGWGICGVLWCLCGWGLGLTIVIAGLVKRVFEDFFPVECLYGGWIFVCFRIYWMSLFCEGFFW